MNVPIVPLGDLCEMDRQGIRPENPLASQLPFVGVENVEGDTGVLDFGTYSRVGEQKSTAYRFDERHVLYAKLRPYLNKVATPGFAGRCSTELVPLLPREGVDREFLAHLLRRKETVDYVIASVTGTRMPRTDMNALMSMRVPFPLLDEQKKIVDVLNRVAHIQRLRVRRKRLLNELVPALFIKMFGDPIENPKGWGTCMLGNLGSLDRGRSRHRPRNAPELYGGEYPFVQTGDVATSGGLITKYSQKYSEVGLAQSRMWPAGTLCITIAANIGMTGVLAFDACFPDSIVGFTPNNLVTVEFIQTSLDLMQSHLEKHAPQAAQRNINLKVLRDLEIPVAPYALQRQYTELVAAARGISASDVTASDTASSMSASLMALLFGHEAQSGTPPSYLRYMNNNGGSEGGVPVDVRNM